MTDLKKQIRDLAQTCIQHDETEASITEKETELRTAPEVETVIRALSILYVARDTFAHQIAEQVRLLSAPRVLPLENHSLLELPSTTHDKILAVLAEGGQVHRTEIAKVVYPKLTIEVAKKRASTKLDQMKRKKEVAQVAGTPGRVAAQRAAPGWSGEELVTERVICYATTYEEGQRADSSCCGGASRSSIHRLRQDTVHEGTKSAQ